MLRYISIKLFLAVIAICSLSVTRSTAQTQQLSKPIIVGEHIGIDGHECDSTKADFDLIAETAGENGLIIAIARFGKGEFTRKLARRRLQNLRDYLYSTRSINEKRIITAEGERVSGFGRVEVYIGGRLFMVFHMKRNKDFFSGCKT